MKTSAPTIAIERMLPVHAQIERQLRRQIAAGALKPGARLPSAAALADQLGVHRITVQKALRRLKLAGLVQRTPRLGTFVKSARAPIRIGVVFGPSLADETAYAFRLLLKELTKTIASLRWAGREYDGYKLPESECLDGVTVAERLKAEAALQAFNGMITVGTDAAGDQAIRSIAQCPLVSHFNTLTGLDVCYDFYHFGWESVAFFARRKLRQIVYLRTIITCPPNNSDQAGCQAACAQFGIPAFSVVQLPPRGALYDEQRDYRRLLALTREWRRTRQWPEAIIISDDVTMRGLGHALTAVANGAGKKVSILTWANKGIRFFYGVPVARYVVPLAEVAQNLVAILRQRLAGRAPAGLPVKIRGRIEGK